ncbi:hypothetical protein M427DRAFT_41671 [Gonapodya prolifera JEL478]|uniref:DNA-dependent protein kinase catalytic subunit n=1 Tax=Gonapodya prolifera (strain JEL478) TaxID=1344416 RepID=A0A139ASW7_GONPJ|nr:hypothetical protein M427DRAFT_41671 [Gonapodya prolifera JEL478]|eukprot:KXS19826.1 hypothetical protein M427DRAFT_41671 [Gonapodya prolifera JEL478]
MSLNANAGASSRPLTASDLLHFATALSTATAKEDAPKQNPGTPANPVQKIDPKWIDIVLGKDDAVRMRECGEVLSKESSTVDEMVVALDELELLVESSDNANNMTVLKLYPPVMAVSKHVSPRLRSMALWVLGTVTQNNPEGQRQFLEAGGLSGAVEALADADSEVRARAVYAISGALKRNAVAVSQFKSLRGFDHLVSVLRGSIETLTKAVPDPSENGETAKNNNLSLARKIVFLLRNVIVDEATERGLGDSSHRTAVPTNSATPLLIEMPSLPHSQNSTAGTVNVATDSAPTTDFPSAILLGLSVLPLISTIVRQVRDSDLVSKSLELAQELIKVRRDILSSGGYRESVVGLRQTVKDLQTGGWDEVDVDELNEQLFAIPMATSRIRLESTLRSLNESFKGSGNTDPVKGFVSDARSLADDAVAFWKELPDSDFGTLVSETMIEYCRVERLENNSFRLLVLMLVSCNSREAGFVSALLFDTKTGALKFVDTTRSSQADANKVLLNLVENHVRRAGKLVVDHVKYIKDTCWVIYNVEQNNKIRTGCLDILAALIETEGLVADPKALGIDEVYERLSNQFVVQIKKLGVTVKISLLILLSDIARYHASVLTSQKLVQLVTWVCQTADELKNKDDASEKLLAGAMTCLTNVLFSCPWESLAESQRSQVTNLMWSAIDRAPLERKNYLYLKAGLNFLTNHARLVRESLFEKFVKPVTDSRLCFWNAHSILPTQITHAIGDPSADRRRSKACLKHQFLVSNFIKVLRDVTNKEGKDVDVRYVAFCVRSFGALARPLKSMDGVTVSDVFLQLDRAVSLFYADPTIVTDDAVQYLGSYMQGLGHVIDELDHVGFGEMSTIGTLSFQAVMFGLYKKGLLRSFWPNMASRVLILTCTDTPAPLTTSSDVEAQGNVKEDVPQNVEPADDPTMDPAIANLVEDENVQDHEIPVEESPELEADLPPHSHTIYMTFWKTIFADTLVKKEAQSGGEMYEWEGFFEEVYDIAARVFIAFPERLDFNTIIREPNEDGVQVSQNRTTMPPSGDLSALVPVQPKDFNLFLNYVSFCDRYFKEVRAQQFTKWISPAADSWGGMATQFPLVSGFYKLLSICMVHCTERDVFQSALKVTSNNNDATSSSVYNGDSVVGAMSLQLSALLEDVLARMKLFQGDLLASCLRFVLATPPELVSLSSFSEPLQMAFQLGLSHPEIADLGVDCLERCIARFSFAKMRIVLEDVLPSLYPYLITDARQYEFDANGGRSDAGGGKAKVSEPLLSNAKRRKDDSGETESTLKLLQRRIASFLGALGGNSHLVLPPAKLRSADGMLAWDPDRKLIYTLPFPNMQVELTYDEILPRVVKLAEESPARKTKIAAGELLHAMILHMVGTSAHSVKDATGESKICELFQGRLTNYYQKIVPVMLRLAIDNDPVIRALFKPLTMGLIHWFTNNAKFESSDTMIMLNACVDAVSAQGQLREFGGECLAEFLAWSIRRTTQDSDVINAKSLFLRLYLLCKDPAPLKRLGADGDSPEIDIRQVFEVFNFFEPPVRPALRTWVANGTNPIDILEVPQGTMADWLLVASEGYGFLLYHDAISPRDIFASPKSLLLQRCDAFLATSLCWTEGVHTPEWHDVFAAETKTLAHRKVALLTSVLRFVSVFVRKLPQASESELATFPLFQEHVFSVLARYLLESDFLGLGPYLREARDDLLSLIRELVPLFKHRFPRGMRHFTETAKNILLNQRSWELTIDPLNVLVHAKAFERILLLHDLELAEETLLAVESVSAITSALFKTLHFLRSPSDPAFLRLGSATLRLLFPHQEAREKLVVDYFACSPSQSSSFFNTYKDVICRELARNLGRYTTERILGLLSSSQRWSEMVSATADQIAVTPPSTRSSVAKVFLQELTREMRILKSLNLAADRSSLHLIKKVIKLDHTFPQWKCSTEIGQFLADKYLSFFATDIPMGMKSDALEIVDVFLSEKVIKAISSQGGWLPLLRALIRQVCRMADHAFKNKFSAAIPGIVKRMNEENLTSFLGFCCESVSPSPDAEIFLWDEEKPIETRRRMVELVMAVAVRSTTKEMILMKVFERHIGTIANMITAAPSSSTTTAAGLQLKACCFNVLEMTQNFDRLGATWNATQKFVGFVTRTSYGAIFEKGLYFTSASVKVTNEQPYFELLFKIRKESRTTVWKHLVDTSSVLRLDDAQPASFVKARLDEYRSRLDTEAAIPRKDSRKNYYLPSVFLSNSSLADDIPFVPESLKSDSSLTHIEPSRSAKESTRYERPFDFIELDQINDNPCMRAVLELIWNLRKRFPLASGVVGGRKPSWMEEIYKEVNAPDTHVNVRLFLVKIIINYPEAFEGHAADWSPVLMKMVIESEKFGQGLNYYVVDLCILLLSWSVSSPILDDSDLINEFMVSELIQTSGDVADPRQHFLVRNAYVTGETQITRNNIKIVQEFMELWKTVLVLPSPHLIRYIENDTSAIAGLSILNSFLVNGVTPNADLTEDLGSRLFENLCLRMKSKSKREYIAAAYIAGLWLSKDSENTRLHDLLSSVVEDVAGDRNQRNHYLVLLYHISRELSAFVVGHISRVLFLFPSLNRGEDKALALQVLARVQDTHNIKEIFGALKGRFLMSALVHRDDVVQAGALEVLINCASVIDQGALEIMLPSLEDVFVDHPSTTCRTAFYGLITSLLEREIWNGTTISQLRAVLLKGLTDPSAKLRESVTGFWRDHITTDVPGALGQITGDLYHSKIDGLFLHHATYLLLGLLESSPAFNAPLFKDGLPHATFHEWSMIVGSAAAQSSLQPLFASTLSQVPVRLLPKGAIRETQVGPPIFTPTITLARQSLESMSASLTSASLGGALGPRSSTQQRKQQTQQQRENDFAHLRRRFEKRTRSQEEQVFTRRAYAQKSKDLRRLVLEKETRERGVNLTRSYRFGDLPDICIPNSDMIKPLQSLATLDNEVASLVFIHVVLGVCLVVERDFKFWGCMDAFYFPFIRIQRTMLEKEYLRCPPALIASSNRDALTFDIGILSVEAIIDDGVVALPSAKRRRKDVDPPTAMVLSGDWLQITSLYRSMGDMDVVRATAEFKLAPQGSMYQKSVAAEMSGNLEDAFESLKSQLEDSSQTMEDYQYVKKRKFLDENFMEVCAKLGEWNVISSYSERIGDMWNDSDKTRLVCKDVYIKYYIRSHLRETDNPKTSEHFETFLSDALKDDGKRLFLEQRYPADVAEKFITSGDGLRGRFYSRLAIDGFLKEFAQLHPSAVQPRLTLLGELQRTREAVEFLDFDDGMKQNAKSSGLSLVENKFSSWRTRFPRDSDPIEAWDVIVSARTKFLGSIDSGERAMDVDGATNGSTSVTSVVNGLKCGIYIKAAGAALLGNSFRWGYDLLKSARSLGHDRVDNALLRVKLNLQSVVNQTQNMEALDIAQTRATAIVSLLDILGKAKNEASSKTSSLFAKLLLQEVDCLDALNDPIINTDTMEIAYRGYQSISSRTEIKKSWIYSAMKKTSDEFASDIQRHQFEGLDQAVNIFLEHGTEIVDVGKPTFGASQFQLARLCDRTLRWLETSEEKKTLALFEERHRYANVMIDRVLWGMSHLKEEAIRLFPRLLQLLELYNISDSFEHRCQAKIIPSWTFLRWIPQLAARLNQSVGRRIIDVLNKLAQDYPRALYHQMVISKEQFLYAPERPDAQSEINLEKLLDATRSPLTDVFVEELEKLSEPKDFWKAFLGDVRPADVTSYRLKEAYDSRPEVASLKIETSFGKLRKYLTSQSLGREHEEYAKILRPLAESVFGSNGANLRRMSPKQIIEAARGVEQKFPKSNKEHGVGSSGKVALNRYSPWLEDYDAFRNFPEASKKFCQNRSTISNTASLISFWNFPVSMKVCKSRTWRKLYTLQDLETPYSACLQFDDQSDWKYVASMKKVTWFWLRASVKTADNRLEVVTYKVIPMTLSLGILEWVEHTRPLGDCIKSMCGDEIYNRGAANMNRWVIANSGRSTGTLADHYIALMAKVNGDQLSRSYINSVHLYPSKSYLRDFLYRMAVTPEAFLNIRYNFTKSLAALSIATYLLGIGDRHLENHLIDVKSFQTTLCLKSGRIVAIDFGHAFGQICHGKPPYTRVDAFPPDTPNGRRLKPSWKGHSSEAINDHYTVW